MATAMEDQMTDPVLWGIDGYDDGFPLPSKKEICPTCHGNGAHGRNLGAYTEDDLEREFGGGHERQQFLDDWRAGMYDSACEACHGIRVIDVPDRNQMTPEIRELYDAQEQETLLDHAIARAERAAGC